LTTLENPQSSFVCSFFLTNHKLETVTCHNGKKRERLQFNAVDKDKKKTS